MAISKGVLLAGLAATGLGLVAATAKKKPRPGEPGGEPASSQPGAEQVVPPEITTSMVRALETGDPARIRATADILEKSGYKAQAADLRAGAVLVEKDAQKKQAEKLAAEAKQKAEDQLRQAAKAAEAAAAAAMPTDLSTSPAVQAVVTKAIATGDSATMRSVAAKLRASGATTAAKSLETAAAAVDAQKLAQLAAATAAPAAAATTPAIVTPGIVQAVQTAASTPAAPSPPVKVTTTAAAPVSSSGSTAEKAALAGQLALSMKGAKKGKENQGLVTAYQQQERLPKKDGLYGSTVALSLANTYGIVPPKPLYWGTKAGGYASYVKDKKDYKAALLLKAARDPARSEEWTAAANV